MIMPASLLQHPPESPAASIEEIMMTAHALEDAAARRYRNLAQAMRKVSHEDVAQVFDDLAAEEEQHVRSVEKMASTLLRRLPTETVVHWVLPETFGAEESGPPASLTPYKALSIAVRAEERAFAFWSYVAANAAAKTIRSLAETMAHQELLHASKLRIARRRAYHAEARRRISPDSNAQLLSLDALHFEAAQMAAEAAAFLSAATTRLDHLGDGASAALLRAIVAAITVPVNVMEAADMRDAGLRAGQRMQQMSAPTVLFEAEGVLERWVERYMNLLDRSPDAAVTAELQRLADQTMSLVAQVNARLAAVQPDLSSVSVSIAPSGSSPR
jgi:rubrerythrin